MIWVVFFTLDIASPFSGNFNRDDDDSPEDGKRGIFQTKPQCVVCLPVKICEQIIFGVNVSSELSYMEHRGLPKTTVDFILHWQEGRRGWGSSRSSRLKGIWQTCFLRIESNMGCDVLWYNWPGWWFQTFFISIIYGIILSIDFHIFQDGYCTTNQWYNQHTRCLQYGVRMIASTLKPPEDLGVDLGTGHEPKAMMSKWFVPQDRLGSNKY